MRSQSKTLKQVRRAHFLDGQIVSLWLYIPLFADKQQNLLHMIVEIPRGTNAKMEVGVLSFFSGGIEGAR